MRRSFILGVLFLILMTPSIKAENTEQNPFLMEYDSPHQTIPFNLIKIEHYTPALDIALEQAYAEMDAVIINPEEPTFENTIMAMEMGGELLSKVTRVMFNLSSTMASPELMACLRDASPKLSKFSESAAVSLDSCPQLSSPPLLR